jgi:hypothetical protein
MPSASSVTAFSPQTSTVPPRYAAALRAAFASRKASKSADLGKQWHRRKPRMAAPGARQCRYQARALSARPASVTKAMVRAFAGKLPAAREEIERVAEAPP